MKILKFLLTIGLASSGCHELVYAEEIGTQTRTYRVQYSDGATENYSVIYHGIVEPKKWQTGKPSTTFHPLDTRKCHWTIETYVTREACLVSRGGQQFCKGQATRVYGISFAGKGSDLQLERLHPENCNDANARYNSDVTDAKAAVNSLLRDITRTDGDEVKDDLMTSLKAINVAER